MLHAVAASGQEAQERNDKDAYSKHVRAEVLSETQEDCAGQTAQEERIDPYTEEKNDHHHVASPTRGGARDSPWRSLLRGCDWLTSARLDRVPLLPHEAPPEAGGG